MLNSRARKPSPAIGSKKRERILSVAVGAAHYFQLHGRSFPWRRERGPYRLAVAEILLQKTRAASVVEVYETLIDRYADPATLANAKILDLETLLKPLGLSRKRALQLTRMAEVLVERGESIFADWKALLTDVPGLGAYGARAVTCFGSGERVGIVDANVARILRRVFAIAQTDTRAAIFQRYADEIALSSPNVIDTNFGLLDIGALACVAKPNCSACTLNACCRFVSRRRRH